MRRSRYVIFSLLLLFLTVAIMAGSARWYLSSGRAAARVATELQAVYGGPVEVGRVQLGLNHATLEGVQVYPEGAKPGEEPWITLADVQADLTPWDLVRGQTMPRQLRLKGMTMTLRFARDGKLLTKLPTSSSTTTTIPEIQLTDGKITWQQEGRPEMAVTGIDASIQSKEGTLVLDGAAHDPYWGNWTTQGTLDPQARSGDVTLRTASPVHVNQEKLNRLPFVPPEVWQEVQADGNTPVEVRLKLAPGAATASYRVDLEPQDARIRIAAIDLTGQQVHGKISVEDNVVQVAGVQARTANGEIQTNAILDFQSDPSTLTIRAKAKGLDLHALPATWSLPRQLGGELNGWADVRISIKDGKAQISGQGRGTIDHAQVAGVPADPIELRLRSDGQRLRFETPAPAAQARPLFAPWMAVLLVNLQAAAPQPEPRWSVTDVPAVVSTLLTSGASQLGQSLGDATAWVKRTFPEKTAQAGKPAAETTYLEANLSLRDVDLEQLLKGLEIKLPIAVRGRLTVQVQAGIPVNTAQDYKAYRLKGNVSLSRLTLQELDLQQVQARINYLNGVLSLDELRGQISGTPGSFQGTARLEAAPPYSYRGELQLSRIDLAAVQRLLPDPPVTLGGMLDTTAKLQGTLDPMRLDATGAGTLASLLVDEVRVDSVRFQWRADTTRLEVTDLRSGLYTGELSGSARLPFQKQAAGDVDIRFKDVDVGALTKAIPRLPLKIQGRASGSIKGAVPGGDNPFNAQVELQAPRLIVQGIPTERLQGTVSYRNNGLDYKLQGQALGGRFDVNGRYPQSDIRPAEGEPQGRLQVQGADLARLGDSFGRNNNLRLLRGRVDLDVRYRHAGPHREPIGTGRFVLTDLRWDRLDLGERVQGDVQLTPQELRFRDLSGTVANGQLRGQVALNLLDTQRSWFNISLGRAEAGLLLAPWPDAADVLRGPVDLRVRGRMGREWTGTAEVVLARGSALGLDVAEWRIPLDWAFSPDTGRGQVSLSESSIQLGSGRAVARGTWTWGYGGQLNGSVRFFNVDLRSLLRQAGDFGSLGTGRLSGTFDFHGNNVQSLKDVNGTLEARFSQTQALQMPVLSVLTPYISPGGASFTFQSGDLRARLGGGILSVQRLNMESPSLRLLIQGTVTVEGGRLNLEAWANTGQIGPNTTLLRRIGLAIPVAGPIPASVILDASRYLSNRILHLRITGTLRQPSVRIDPVALVTEEAIRYFLRSANVPLP